MSDLDDLLALAQSHRKRRQRLAAATTLTAARLWRRLDPQRLTQTWDASVGRELVRVLTAAQLNSATTSEAYVRAAMTIQGIEDDADGRFNPEALAGIASDGRALASLLYQALSSTRSNLGQGAGTREAMDMGQRQLEMITQTQVIDAGRVGDQVSLVARPRARGYVRYLTPPSCSRCAILAGRVYGSQQAFPRHPRCDCVHVPVGSAEAGNALKTDVRSYFESLSESEQDRLFTKNGARAIRDGADPGQVINSRRGMTVAGSWVQRLEGPEREGRTDLRVTHRGRVVSGGTTTEGMTTRGFAGRRTGPIAGQQRLMPEMIYRIASDREEAVALLRRFGYLH